MWCAAQASTAASSSKAAPAVRPPPGLMGHPADAALLLEFLQNLQNAIGDIHRMIAELTERVDELEKKIDR